MEKPSWFRFIDLVTMAGLGVVCAGLALYATLAGVEGPKSTGGLILCWVVAGFCVSVWAWFCAARKKWLDEFTWYPEHGIMAHPGEGYGLPSREEMARVVSLTMDKWSAHLDPAGVEDAVKEEVIWCFFKKGMDEGTRNLAGRKVQGYTISGTHQMFVDFDTEDQPLETTAFEHELGHVIMGNVTGEWDQTVHHAFMQGHGLK